MVSSSSIISINEIDRCDAILVKSLLLLLQLSGDNSSTSIITEACRLLNDLRI